MKLAFAIKVAQLCDMDYLGDCGKLIVMQFCEGKIRDLYTEKVQLSFG